jgi:invasion protein IalB
MTFPAFSSPRRAVVVCAIAAISLAGALVSVDAASKKSVDKKVVKKDEAAKPALVASFGDWNVFVGQAGKGRICYVLAQPKSREPAGLNRDPGYAFISDRPAEGVRNEVSFIMGFDVAAGADNAEAKPETKTSSKRASKSESKSKTPPVAAPVAMVDEATFEMLPKGADLWVKNAAREAELIVQMRKGSKLVVKASSLKGHPSTDVYSLTGFSQAMDRLLKECPGK